MSAQTGDRLGVVALFVALFATILALGAALAHAYELPNKIGLTRDAYFTVQQIYSGWNQIAYVLAFELAGTLAAIYFYRHRSAVRWPCVFALAFFFASQVIFWIWTYPANVATDQWTTQPENWEILRRNWEYSHLAGAGFQLLAASALIIATLPHAEQDLQP